ncbi:hypothetical protein LMQ51_000763 [Campylobacter coli]|nr:hypothetical protein [Campylobacter coli]EIM1028898.1 hypothetical protein [Campylobacter coli]HEB7541365.1 hypothetical protein [Campylobacter coli]HEB9350988.1 hypothetical protein [Campylobacter coli]HEH5495867.1 hypothetical protein [Campylobacter coli]
MKEINQNAFFDELLVMYLYKKRTVSTLDIEELFGGEYDFQNSNNPISNRKNKVTYINKNYIEYDENKQELKITENGKDYIREKFPPKPRKN